MRSTVGTAGSSSYAPPMLVLKGERHTGTNFLKLNLVRNFGEHVFDRPRNMSGALGGAASNADHPSVVGLDPTPTTMCEWKHGYAHDSCQYRSDPATAYVTLARSPYPWLLSLHRR